MIAKSFLETGIHSSKSELQSYVLAKLKFDFEIMCFPGDYDRLTLDDYQHVHGIQHFSDKIGRIRNAINAFQHPKKMVNILHFNQSHNILIII